MAQEDAIRLFRDARNDAALREQFNEAPDLEAFVQMAKAHGYDFTVKEWQEVTNFSLEEVKGKLSKISGL